MRQREWAHWVGLIGNLSIIVTLVVLTLELRGNTAAIERAALVDRYERVFAPYLAAANVPAIYAKVKQKDGATEPRAQAFSDGYGLSTEEAVAWVRHLDLIWAGIEADFLYQGRSDQLDILIRGLLQYPDNRLYWEAGGSASAFTESPLAVYVAQLIRASP